MLATDGSTLIAWRLSSHFASRYGAVSLNSWYSCRWFLRHQQMERQGGECASRHHEQVPLVTDQRLDWLEQRHIEFVSKTKIEHHGLARVACLFPLIDIEAATEGGNLPGELIRADRDRSPIEALTGQREDVTLFVGGQEKDKRLVRPKQLLHLLGLEWLWARQRRILGEVFFEPRRDRNEPALGICDLLADVVDHRLVALAFRLRQCFDQRLVALAPEDREILVLAHERRHYVPASSEAQAHLLDRRRRGRRDRQLGGFESFATERRRGFNPLLRGSRDVGDQTEKIVRAAFNEITGLFVLPNACRFHTRMGGYSGGRFARKDEGIAGIAGCSVKDGQLVESSATAGWLGPSTCSWIASARLKSPSASS